MVYEVGWLLVKAWKKYFTILRYILRCFDVLVLLLNVWCGLSVFSFCLTPICRYIDKQDGYHHRIFISLQNTASREQRYICTTSLESYLIKPWPSLNISYTNLVCRLGKGKNKIIVVKISLRIWYGFSNPQALNHQWLLIFSKDFPVSYWLSSAMR